MLLTKDLIISRKGTVKVRQKIKLKCDECFIIFERSYSKYRYSLNKWGGDYCYKCIHKLFLRNNPKNLTTDKISLVCIKCKVSFERLNFYIEKYNEKYKGNYCYKCISSFQRKVIGIRSLDKINVICDRCANIFERTNFNIKVSNEKHNGKYCCNCINYLINNREEVKIKHKKNSLLNIKLMSKEERKFKYGNDYWKENIGFLKQQKNRDGHREQVINSVYKLSKEERQNKYGQCGELNGMYGKPAPKNSGYGYKGYYYGLFFRSLLELSYLTSINIKEIKNAEKLISIPYYYIDRKRTYRPDFILNNFVIEIKPKSFLNLEINKIKFEYAIKWCNVNGYMFKVISNINNLNIKEINTLIQKRDLIFTEKSLKRFKKRFEGIT